MNSPQVPGLEGLMQRRDLLRVGSLSIAATALPAAMLAGNRTTRAAGTNEPREGKGRAKSVIFLWMAGGVTHIDSFDPKPDAPIEIRGTLDDMPTNVPGMRFCETLPHLAKIADKLAVLRSYSHDSNDHLLSQVYTLSGKKIANMTQLFSEPNIGSLIWQLQGPRNGLPGYIAVPGITRPGPPPYNLFVGGWLGKPYRAVLPGGHSRTSISPSARSCSIRPPRPRRPQAAIARPARRSDAGPPLQPPAAARFVRPGAALARQERHDPGRGIALRERPSAA